MVASGLKVGTRNFLGERSETAIAVVRGGGDLRFESVNEPGSEVGYLRLELVKGSPFLEERELGRII